MNNEDGATLNDIAAALKIACGMALSKECRIIVEACADKLLDAGWRDIKTAPMDGTAVLILLDDKGRKRYCVAEYEYGWGPADIIAYEADVIGTPTHWMPLPVRPNAIT